MRFILITAVVLALSACGQPKNSNPGESQPAVTTKKKAPNPGLKGKNTPLSPDTTSTGG